MPPPMNKFRFYTNILVSTLLSILLLLIILHFAGYLAQLEGGVYVGFGTALLAWTATIIAILADASIVMMFVLHGHSISVLRLYKKYRPLFIAFPFAFAALILILQFGTPYLRYVEAGISDGIAPPILLGIAPLLSMLAIVGLILYSWKTKLLSRSIAVGEQKAGEINQPKQVQEDLSSKEAAKGQLEMISSLLDKSEMQKLVGAEWGYDESRDRLQTKKNIETWILESVKAANRVSKSRLEAEFERQFPTAYLALFNSVLYDLVYRDKLEVIREEGKTMICLHGADRKQNGKTAKF
jgi:hypothetical protein